MLPGKKSLEPVARLEVGNYPAKYQEIFHSYNRVSFHVVMRQCVLAWRLPDKPPYGDDSERKD